jgi:hypothetical protein
MLSLRSLSFALTLMILLASAGKGQSGSASVTIGGHVSETAILSIAPSAQRPGSEAQVGYSNLNPHTILVSITQASGSPPAQIAIPAQIRSNVGYTLSVSAKRSGTLVLRALSVAGKRATGRFVALDAVEAIDVAAAFDATAPSTERTQVAWQPALRFPSASVTLLTGPRVSLAGTFDSPHNAVEVMILAEVEASARGAGGHVELILSVAPQNASSSALASR